MPGRLTPQPGVVWRVELPAARHASMTAVSSEKEISGRYRSRDIDSQWARKLATTWPSDPGRRGASRCAIALAPSVLRPPHVCIGACMIDNRIARPCSYEFVSLMLRRRCVSAAALAGVFKMKLRAPRWTRLGVVGVYVAKRARRRVSAPAPRKCVGLNQRRGCSEVHKPRHSTMC